jgi:hypothetical protein
MKKIILTLSLILLSITMLTAQEKYTKSTNTLELKGLDSKIKLNGSSSGSLILKPPASAGSSTVTLPSGTLTLASTQNINDSLAKALQNAETAISIGDTTTRRAGNYMTLDRTKTLLFDSLAANIVLKLTPRANPPSGAKEGMIYSSTDHHLYYYNGTTWIQLDN